MKKFVVKNKTVSISLSVIGRETSMFISSICGSFDNIEEIKQECRKRAFQWSKECTLSALIYIESTGQVKDVKFKNK